MSDIESESDTELVLRGTEGTEDHINSGQISRESHFSPAAQRDNANTPRCESTLEKAVNDMVTMQSQMSECLKDLSKFIIGTLTTSSQSQSHVSSELNNNFHESDRGVSHRRRPYREHNPSRRDDYAEDENSYSTYHRQSNSRPHQRQTNIKLPSFTGKEEWAVWINRFEAIAERQHWSDEDKLDQLLPKLDGDAGTFVFTQLKREVLNDYDELVREINNRFRIIESPKTFATKFSKRDQRPHETAEAYAAELKCMYDKAYRERDRRTRREDLVRRFLDGLRDGEMSWKVEYIKDPLDIDEAVYHVVNCIQTRSRHRVEGGRGNLIRQTAELVEEDEVREEINRVSAEKLPKITADDTKPVESDMLQKILDKLTELSASQRNEESSQPRKQRARNVVCFVCNQPNHYARECPLRYQHPPQGMYHTQQSTQQNGGVRQFCQLPVCDGGYVNDSEEGGQAVPDTSRHVKEGEKMREMENVDCSPTLVQQGKQHRQQSRREDTRITSRGSDASRNPRSRTRHGTSDRDSPSLVTRQHQAQVISRQAIGTDTRQHREARATSKFERTYKDPHITDENFTWTDNVGREKLVHHYQLQPYEGKSPPGWIRAVRHT